jgi:hypothetical protein
MKIGGKVAHECALTVLKPPVSSITLPEKIISCHLKLDLILMVLIDSKQNLVFVGFADMIFFRRSRELPE